MKKRRTLAIMAVILLLFCGIGAAAALYFKADREPPVLTLRTGVTWEYGQPLSMYELVDRVKDDSRFTLSVSAPQGTLTEDKKSVQFPALGTYQVVVTARDEHGHESSEVTLVEVVDTTPPVISAEEFTVFVGKDLNYQEHVSAEDLADGDLTKSIQCNAAKVSLKEPGRYPITYTVTDRSGNTAALTSYVNVIYPPASKITLSEQEIWLAGNEYDQLKAKVKPSGWHGVVEWTSSDSAVAEVSDGLVVWKGVGECVITARAGEKEATCTVHCEPPRATAIWLNRHSLTLDDNESETLTAQVLPSNWQGTVQWSCSDPAVATVNENGVVTRTGGGTCTITAVADDFSDSCEVTCKSHPVQDFLDDLFGGGNSPGMIPYP